MDPFADGMAWAKTQTQGQLEEDKGPDERVGAWAFLGIPIALFGCVLIPMILLSWRVHRLPRFTDPEYPEWCRKIAQRNRWLFRFMCLITFAICCVMCIVIGGIMETSKSKKEDGMRVLRILGIVLGHFFALMFGWTLSTMTGYASLLAGHRAWEEAEDVRSRGEDATRARAAAAVEQALRMAREAAERDRLRWERRRFQRGDRRARYEEDSDSDVPTEAPPEYSVDIPDE